MRIFCLLALLLYAVDAQQVCSDFGNAVDCSTSPTAACAWIGGLDGDCRCASEVKLDILFGVDASGSIGNDNFEIQRQFLHDLVARGVANESRVGFLPFSTNVYTVDRSAQTTVNYYRTKAMLGQLPIDFWDEDELFMYVENLYWLRQWTNTPQLIIEGLKLFDALPDKAGRQSVFIILTDGNPCLEGACGADVPVCQLAPDLKNAGIRVMIIAVGTNIKKGLLDCLLEDPVADWLEVDGFTQAAFESIMYSLSGVLCPITKRCKLTEIKPMRKPVSWDQDGDGRLTRYIEIWNDGIDFSLQTLKLEGFVNFDGAENGVPDVNIPQSSYVVFYDASDLPGDATFPSAPTCHSCDDCDLTNCANANTATTDNCFCENSVYIGCGSAPGADASCPLPGGLTSANGVTAVNLCAYCTINNAMDGSNWEVTISDIDQPTPIDTVVYGAEGFWQVLPDKFSYELISRGYDNDNGNNWAWSCNEFGTPGAPPSATCDKTCVTQGGCGGIGQCVGQNCLCNLTLGYYPICSLSYCHTCAEVPSIEFCTVEWLKNNSHPLNRKYAVYSWTDSGYDGHLRYRLNYNYDASDATQEAFTSGELSYSTADFNPDDWVWGGYVQTEIEVCVNTTFCTTYYSTKTDCLITTSAPTLAPTFSPSDAPTPAPTSEPTRAPTWGCPNYYWIGGTSEEICNYDNNQRCYDDDTITDGQCPRCSCYMAGQQCCLLFPDFNVVYDAERQHKDTFDCKLDVELAEPQDRSEGEDKAGISNGYLLTTQTHNFAVGIIPEGYPCVMDIFWSLEFDDIICSGGNSEECDGSEAATVEAAGLEIDVLSGHLVVWTAADLLNTTIEFTVSRSDCTNGCESFQSLTLLGNLLIVNATSRCDADCEDGRMFPMRIPVWYNYDDALTVAPSQETEIPSWLWWLIAALVVFLGMLAFLLYRYWWKNKKVGAALSGVQDDIDAAVMEQEDGFGAGISGNQVGFNPLATGFNPNAAAGAVGPNAPPGGQGGAGNFVKPNVEKQVFRQEYGQELGKMG